MAIKFGIGFERLFAHSKRPVKGSKLRLHSGKEPTGKLVTGALTKL